MSLKICASKEEPVGVTNLGTLGKHTNPEETFNIPLLPRYREPRKNSGFSK